MKPNQKSKTPEQLFLGLTLGLAVSLCALEYGKPWLGKAEYTPVGNDESQFISEMIPITFPKPPKPPEVEIVSKPIINQFEIVNEMIESTPESDPSDLPEFEFNLDDWPVDGAGDTTEFGFSVPFIDVHKKPEFKDLEGYLANHLRYPTRMREREIEATMGVQFTVGTDGKILEESIHVINSPNNDFTREVIRVFENMPAWIPGEQRGKKVAVTHTLPIRFRLK